MILPEEIKKTQNTLFSDTGRLCQEIRRGIFYCKSLGTRQIKTELCCDENIKVFCEENDIPYADIEDAWLNYKVGGKNNG